MFHRTRVVALLAMLLATPAWAAEPSAVPNVLLVTADDLGCQLSCYGETRFRTPRLDALAAEGVRFERFYVAQPSCSSSRSALLTGLWPHQNGQIGLAHLGFRMRPGQENLPSLLKAAGYHTGIIGKLHVEPAAEFPWDWMPQKLKMAGLPTRNVRWVAEQSRQFFASAKAVGRPFFYYVNFFDPHGPYNREADQVEGLPAKPLGANDVQQPYPLRTPNETAKKRVTATIINTILRADAGMGLLLDELKLAGLADNTLVVFLGDNGLPVERGKGTCYEAGVHVPLLIRWPGVTKPGQVCHALACEVDLLPTMLAAAGVGRPPELAGRPLQPLLQNQSVAWREFLFTEMNFHEPQQCNPQRSVRDDRHKLLLHLAPRGGPAVVELFDLQSDPAETKNRADDASLAPTRRRLEAALGDWRQPTRDPLLDAARLQRWLDAAKRWDKLPRVKAGPNQVVRIPEGELKLLD